MASIEGREPDETGATDRSEALPSDGELRQSSICRIWVALCQLLPVPRSRGWAGVSSQHGGQRLLERAPDLTEAGSGEHSLPLSQEDTRALRAAAHTPGLTVEAP